MKRYIALQIVVLHESASRRRNRHTSYRCNVLRSRAMARLGRYFLPDQPLHAIQRGNNREAIFFAEDFACYRDRLAAAAAE
jgi:hypothetical protein